MLEKFHLERSYPGGDWPVLFLAGDTTLVYAVVDPAEDFYPELLSEVPDGTWLDHELCDGGFAALVDGGEGFCGPEDWIQWALEQGVCPDQWFVLEMVPDYSRTYCWEYACYEYDFACTATVTARQQLSPETHLQRWLKAFDDLPDAKENPFYTLVG